MPLVKTIRKRGATTTIEANAEVLFLPSGPIGPWLGRLTRSVKRATIAAAPSNKRPRWDHYGVPLKQSFEAKTRLIPGTMRAHSVVGSSARHSVFVDQGTGIYTEGGTPYEAKILPPYAPGSPTLYERTWGSKGPGRSPVMIKGQKGQFFFEKGLVAGLTSMRIPSVEVPDGVVAAKKTALPLGMLNDVLGNNSGNAAFRPQLEEWRSWRDAAWKSGRALGRSGEGGSTSAARRRANTYRRRAKGGPAPYSPEERILARRANAVRYRDKIRGGPVQPKKPVRVSKPDRQPTKPKRGNSASRNAFFAAVQRKYGWADRQSLATRDGYYVVTVRVKGDRGRYEYREVRAKIKG